MSDLKRIRNFSIIAHIDHGKSTLADRFIQICGGLTDTRNELIKCSIPWILSVNGASPSKPNRFPYIIKPKTVNTYLLNFIDTPGHVDFSYEVSRSLAACEGAILVVDAAQGVEAQTVAVCYTAIDQALTVLPVLNKIDLPQAEPDRVISEIEDIIGLDAHDAIRVSAKSGLGVEDVLEALVQTSLHL